MDFGGQWGDYGDTEISLVLMGHRYYDTYAGRFLTRDPIGYDGGVNLYSYTANDYVNEIDPDGHNPTKDKEEGDAVALGALDGMGKAYVFVRDTTIAWYEGGPSVPVVNGLTRIASLQDAKSIASEFRGAGYDVTVCNSATRNDIIGALSNPNVKAIAYIGHSDVDANKFVGLVPIDATIDILSEIRQQDITAALSGRQLDWAIMHNCLSAQNDDLKNSLIGKNGRFEGSVGDWDPILGIDLSLRHRQGEHLCLMIRTVIC